MKMYYIANARMPTEKAHGIQIAKMCEAFIEAGVELILIVPNRTTDLRSLRDYYNLRVDVPLVRIPTLDWYGGGHVGYFLSSASFMLSYLFFIWRKKRGGERFILYTVDTDNYSSSVLAFLGNPFFSEMHGAKLRTIAQRILFGKVNGIIAINKIIVEELQKNFPHPHIRYIVEPNGVDSSSFAGVEKSEARKRLGLPHDMPIVLYAGRFFEWKGLEILPQAAAKTPFIRWQVVGGDRSDFSEIVGETLPENLFFAGSRPHSEMPLWFSAADVLLVLGTARDIQSYRYTSPMKLFEYLASGRTIVASNTPAIREIVSEKEVIFYTPDDPLDMARAVQSAVHSSDEEISLRIEAAMRLAKTSSWRGRAERIVHFIEKTTCS
jgi:glycosyltransferase involved in cell wall biosynthesis